jgi:hypothetical protein
VSESAEDQKEDQDNGEHEEVISLALARFRQAEEAERDARTAALDDLKFSAGEQWPDDVVRGRESDKRPCLTINRLPQFIRQITNDQRQNRPAIRVSPVDSNADVETAKIYQGMIRHIEYSSDADIAYDTAFDSAVRCGFGYYRILTEYCDPYSFDQEIRIKRIKNRFSVYLDPSYQQPDGSDANWAFIFDDITEEDYENQYPDSELTSIEDWATSGLSKEGWVQKGFIRIAEYFTKEFTEITLVQLDTGEVGDENELKARIESGAKVIAKRKSQVPVIKWRLINGKEILEERILPGSGKWIPIIPVLGDELDIEGKRVLEGIVRHAKDSQRMYNYWASSETETIALAPRAPYIGMEGQFEGHEESWRTANTKNHAFLQYKGKTLANGQPAPPPQRNAYEPPVVAITQARMQAAEDMKATTGIYDAALGARSNENSGVAIQRRNQQTQTSNFHHVDNLTKSIRHGGRIIVDWMPYVYDTARAVRILGEDGTEEIVRINQEFQRRGQNVHYQMGVGKYDVTVSTGPSYETKRQEAVASMLEFIKAYPQFAAAAGDLIVKNMDWAGKEELAERIKKTMPPGLVDDPDKKPIPPEVQAQLQEMSQMIEALTGQLNQANEKINAKTIELESRERIELAKIQANLELEMAKMGSEEGMFLLKQEVADIERRLSMLNFNSPIEGEGSSTFDQNSMNQDLNSAGLEQTGPLQTKPPTGGLTPGKPME